MSRFFDLDSPIMRTLSFLFDCMVMSFLFLLCCLPVFTTGAAFSALYHCAGYMADGSDAGIRDFFGAFRRSFKRATPIWLLALALGLLLTANLLLNKNMPGGIQIFMLAGDLCLLLWMVLAGISLFPLIHLHPDVSVRQLIPKAFLFSILYLPRTALAALVLLLPVILLFVSASAFLTISIFFLFFWPGLTACAHVKLLRQRLETFTV